MMNKCKQPFLPEVYKLSMPRIENFQTFESLDGGCLGNSISHHYNTTIHDFFY
jgi:hypothetical protein